MSNTAPPAAATAPILKEDVMVLNMGPQHPSTHGVLRLMVECDGETVTSIRPGIEKIAEHRTYTGAAPYMDRLDYIAAVSNNLAYVGAVEKAGRYPGAAQGACDVRVILTELTRIASHLLWLGTHAMDIGALTVFLYCFREREDILNILEMTTGARLTTNAFRVGGLAADIPDGFVEKTRAFCDMIGGRIDEHEGLLSANRIWLARTRGIGAINRPATPIAIGLVRTVAARFRGEVDLRKAQPYEAYSKLRIRHPRQVPTATPTTGTWCASKKCASRERIILQALDGMPEGDFRAKVPRVPRRPPARCTIPSRRPRANWAFISSATVRRIPTGSASRGRRSSTCKADAPVVHRPLRRRRGGHHRHAGHRPRRNRPLISRGNWPMLELFKPYTEELVKIVIPARPDLAGHRLPDLAGAEDHRAHPVAARPHAGRLARPRSNPSPTGSSSSSRKTSFRPRPTASASSWRPCWRSFPHSSSSP